MLDGHLLVDAHVHVPVLGSLKPAWVQWAREFGPDGILDRVWDADGRIDPAALDELFAEQGVDAALLFCEYSPKVTGIQRFEDLLPIVAHNPRGSGRSPTSTRTCTSRSPTSSAASSTRAQRRSSCTRSTGASAATTPALWPAYAVLAERGVPLIVHCGTSSFPGSMNELAHPEHLLPVVRDFPTLDVVLAHAGRGWWYDAAAFMAQLYPTVWLELSGLPPKRLPEYFAKYDLNRLARKWIFAHRLAGRARRPPTPGLWPGSASRTTCGRRPRPQRAARVRGSRPPRLKPVEVVGPRE